MSGVIECQHMNHINAVIDNFDATTDHFREIYGAQFLCDLPNAAWHACLMAIAGAIFEFFAPHDELLHGRIGPHYLGVEYQVPDVSQARAVVEEHDMRIIRDSGVSFHTHPADGFGVAFEFYERSFHDDPPPTPYLEPLAPVSWYRDDHPLGCVGLLAYVIAVDNVDAAVSFLQDLTGASLVSQSHLPSTTANAVNLLLADTGVTGLRPPQTLTPSATSHATARASSRVYSGYATWSARRRTSMRSGSRCGALSIPAR